MTRDELQQMLETIVEQKLIDLLGNPDMGLELRDEVRERLIRQLENVAAGGRGISLQDFKRDLRAK